MDNRERMLWVARILVVGGFAGLAIVAIGLLRPASSDTATPPGGPTGSPRAAVGPGEFGPTDERYANVGEPAPDFRLLKADAVTPFELHSLRGKPVLLNFWASWCGPCREEMPDINQAYLDGAGSLEVVGINYKEPDLVARGFAYELDVAFPLVLDQEGSVADRYHVTGLPVSYFVDRDGIVRAVNIGFMSKQVLAEKLKTVGIGAE